ncbi:hypothetical protein CLOM_g2550 [Closterium sp. NIES-68]|nr:hypothetical protein CLOM_g2550 [Closterium sp. NIES-68]
MTTITTSATYSTRLRTTTTTTTTTTTATTPTMPATTATRAALRNLATKRSPCAMADRAHPDASVLLNGTTGSPYRCRL